MRDIRWKRAFLLLCALALATTIAVSLDELGFGGRPWFGWWDANITIAQPFVLAIAPSPNGAAARSGLHAGDRIDLRRQSLAARIALTYQLMGTHPTAVTIDRGGLVPTIPVTGSSLWDNATPVKLDSALSRTIAGLVFVLCATLLTLRRWYEPQARAVALALICAVGLLLDPSFTVVPIATLSLLMLLISRSCAATAAVALLRAARPQPALGTIAFGAVGLGFAADLTAIFGLATLRIDPLPFILSLSTWRSLADVAIWFLVALACLPARAVRPLPIAFLVSAACFALPAFVHAWLANMVVIVVANIALPLGAILASMAVLKAQVGVPRFAVAGLMCALMLGVLSTSAPAATDHQHDFDFEFGAWTATLRMQPRPLTDSAQWVTLTGTSIVHKLWNGRGNYGELEVRNANTQVEGLTLRLYDPKAQMWNVYFANSKSGVLDTTPMVGRFDGDRGVFYASEPYNGKVIRVRFVFSDITPTTFGFTQSFSADNGKTWVPNWIATFVRVR
jgi:hypothetical protein